MPINPRSKRFARARKVGHPLEGDSIAENMVEFADHPDVNSTPEVLKAAGKKVPKKKAAPKKKKKS